MFEGLRASSSGFLVKDTEPAELLHAIRLDGLTGREREVMALVACGLSSDELAAHLVVSPATTKTHVSRVMSKLDARDRAQVVVIAYESGLVKPGHADDPPRR